MLIPDRAKTTILLFLLAAPGAGLILLILGQDRPKADFTFVNQCEVASLDPAICTEIPEGRIIMALFEGLATFSPQTLEPLPAVARSWDISDNGLTYTFHIRPGLRWSDGTPLNSRDVLYSWLRFLAPETAAPYAFLLYRVAGARAFCAGGEEGRSADPDDVGLSAPDDLTFVVRLESPCPYFLNLVAFYPLYPVCRSCIERHGPSEWLKPEKLVSNGPFRVRERSLKDRIRLERNPFYWDRENVAVGTIDALAIDSPITALNLYLTGAVDWINVVPPRAIPALRDRPDFSVTDNLGTSFLRFNTTGKPLNDVRVRRAILLAIDGRVLVEGVLKGGQTVATSFVPRSIPGYTPPEDRVFDPERARQLLAEAGFPGGKDFPGLNLLYAMNETTRDLAEVIAIQLKRNLAIHVHPASQERQVYRLSQRTLDYQICLCSWLGDYLDPSTFLDVFSAESGNNRTGWKNDDYDSLLREAAAELNREPRSALLARAEEILLAEAPIAVLYYRCTSNMISPEWEGYENNILDVHPLKFLRRRTP
jgi:oligopeptide transport system substrate-binding protein